MIEKLIINKHNILVLVFSIIAILYDVLESNLILNILSILAYFFVLVGYDKEYSLYALLFFAPWEPFSVIPGISFLTVMELMLVIRVIVWFLRNNIKINLMDFITFCMLLVYGYISFKKTGTVTIFRMSIIVMLSIFLRQLLQRKCEEERKNFWKRIFYFIFITSLLSSLYGYVTLMTGNSYYSGRLGIFRIGATVGIDRSCLMCCAGLIYPIFYQKEKKWLRRLFIGYLSMTLLMSVSMTGIITYISFIIVYFYYAFKETNTRRKENLLIGLAICILGFLIVWNFESGISVIDNAINRLKNTIYYLEIGDYSNATTSRSDIFEQYQGSLSSMSLRERLFGTGYTSFYDLGDFSHYTHNTFLDMYTCFGIIPMIYLFIRRINNLYIQKIICESSFIKLILLEMVYILPCLSVSMLTNGYWFYIFLLF